LAAREQNYGLKLVEELLLFVERSADCHCPAVDDEAYVQHEMRNLRVPFLVLQTDCSSSIFSWHAKEEKCT
jgi:hypothetical protein